MSKSDLSARLIFHRAREAIDAHLTIRLHCTGRRPLPAEQNRTESEEIINLLKPLREVTINVGGHKPTAHPQIP